MKNLKFNIKSFQQKSRYIIVTALKQNRIILTMRYILSIHEPLWYSCFEDVQFFQLYLFEFYPNGFLPM